MTDYVHTGIPWNGEYECPVCHGENIDTDDSGPDYDYYYYDMYCEDCGAIFRQWYRMVPCETSYSTKEEQEQYRPVSHMPSELPPAMPISVPPSELPHVELRHNYDLAPVSDKQTQCRCDTATRNLRMPKANWQAINEALNES